METDKYNYKKWTKAEKEYVKNNYKGGNAEAIAVHLGRSISSIRNVACQVGATDPSKAKTDRALNKPWDSREVRYILENKGKKTLKEMSEHLGRSIASVTGKLSKYDLTKTSVKMKATEAQVFLYNLGLLDFLVSCHIHDAIWTEE